MTVLKSGQKVDPQASYVVSGWASVNEGTEGPPVFDLVTNYVASKGTVSVAPNDSVKIVGL